jgi:protein phosphatase 1 regulatory subunit 7
VGHKAGGSFFGHYGSSVDASRLEFLPDVQALSIDCLMEAQNLEALSGLKRLLQLSRGIYRLNSPRILSFLPMESWRGLS